MKKSNWAKLATILAVVSLCVGVLPQHAHAGDKKKKNGEACFLNSQCKSNQCSFGKCVRVVKQSNGSKCTSDQDCKSGECKKLRCVPRKKRLLKKGQACWWDGDCKSGSCVGVLVRRCE